MLIDRTNDAVPAQRNAQHNPVGSTRRDPAVGSEALRLLAGEPSATAVVTANGTLSYAELDERVRARRDELGLFRSE